MLRSRVQLAATYTDKNDKRNVSCLVVCINNLILDIINNFHYKSEQCII